MVSPPVDKSLRLGPKLTLAEAIQAAAKEQDTLWAAEPNSFVRAVLRLLKEKAEWESPEVRTADDGPTRGEKSRSIEARLEPIRNKAQRGDFVGEYGGDKARQFDAMFPLAQTATIDAAPVRIAESGPTADEDWKERARYLAWKIIRRQAERDLYPPQTAIADEIAKKFRGDAITGASGLPLSGAYIKRHALRGIKSALKKPRSTAQNRGNRGNRGK